MTDTLSADLGLATPSGVLVYDGPPHSDAWFAARARGITATDMTKIMGCSQYGNAVSVWAEKLGRWDDEAGEAAWWGTEIEPLLAKRWTLQTGVHTREIGVLAHIEHPTHIASLDRLNLGCPDGDAPCALEIKTRSAFVRHQWRSEIPDDVYVQTQWQMHVTGYDHVHVAVLFGGNTPEFHRVDVDHEDVDLFVREADRVWQHVLDNTQPEAMPNRLALDVLDRLYARREGQIEMDAAHAGALLADVADARETRRAARAAAKRAEASYDAAVARVVAEFGPAQRAYIPGQIEPVFDYVERRRDGYVVKPFTYRELKFKPPSPADASEVFATAPGEQA